ncbi:MAG TPA: carbohydrate ABC transporter permease [Candidatus Ozemobacteraceae bacterium]|nr:carbohydrate ABC transporter permease [Candidatus Ozemobacteraceae bacterium]
MSSSRRTTTTLLSAGLLSLGLVLTLGPLVWMLITAFTDPAALEQSPPRYGVWSLENFRLLLSGGRMFRWTLNSLVTAALITAGQLLFNALAAFSFSVGRFRGRELLFWTVLAAMMVPGQIVMLPLFLFLARWGLIDSLWAVILPSLAAPFGIYMIRQYMDSIPRQLQEAARMDGAGEFDIFRYIYFPLSAPILATSGIFIFIAQWNAFLWPLVMLNSEASYTLPVGLATMQDQQIMDYGLLMAGATFAALPMVLVFLLFSRHLLEGMRSGAVQ